MNLPLSRKVAQVVFFFVVSSLLLVLFSPQKVFASYEYGDYLEAIKDPNYNQPQAGTHITGDTINGLVTIIAGCPDEGCPTGLQVGAIGTMSNMIAGLYANPPASGVMYALDVIDNFRLAKPAYAQGTGFTALSPLLPIWRAFRNFTYLFFVLIFVGMGLAIMFRAKISPQAVVTIQSALPQIVVALLLVTFSYAIAGFVVDLIYVAISLVILTFSQVPDVPFGELQQQFLTGGFGQAAGATLGIVGAVPLLVTTGLGAIAGAIAGVILFVPGGLAVAAGLALGAALAVLILLLIILYLLFKLFIELLKAYIGIILAVVFAPFQIALGVIPGFPGFGQWFKGLAANALVFPAVAFVLILGRVIVHYTESWNGLWAAPLLGFQGDLLKLLLGFGFLLIVYQVPPAVKKALGAEELGFAPGAALGVVPRLTGTGFQLVTRTPEGGWGKWSADRARGLFRKVPYAGRRLEERVGPGPGRTRLTPDEPQPVQ